MEVEEKKQQNMLKDKKQSWQRTITPKFFYLLIQIFFEDEKTQFADYLLKSLILNSMREMFGIMTGSGLSVGIELFSFDSTKNIGLIRVPLKSFVQLWSCLALISVYDGKSCRIEIKKVSQFLTSLSI